MKTVKPLALAITGLGAAVLVAGCNPDSFFNRFKAHASVYYYNQITSNGATDQNALTNTFYVDADEGDNSGSQVYSGSGNAGEMQVGLSKDDVDNGVRIRGESKTGATLFSDRVQLAKDGSYVAVAYGDTSSGSVDVGVWTQDESDVSSGSARYRIIDTVNDNILNILSVDLRITGDSDPFVQDLQMGDATDYRTTGAGNLSIDVLNASSSTNKKIDTVDCNLVSGKSYDVILAFKDPLNPPTDPDNANDDLALYCHRQDKP